MINWFRSIAAGLDLMRLTDIGQSAVSNQGDVTEGGQADGTSTTTETSCSIHPPTNDPSQEQCRRNEEIFSEVTKLVKSGSNQQLQQLLQKEQKWLPLLLSMRDHEGYTFLQRAVMNNQLDTVQFLVEHGADINGPICGRPLHLAAKLGLAKMVELLLQLGADPNVLSAVCYPQEHTYFCFTYSQISGRWGPACMGDLYTPLQAQKQTFEYPIFYAVMSNDVKTVQTLLQKKVVKLHSVLKFKPWLHLACELDAANLVTFFLSRDKNIINCADEDGFTPLMYAVMNNCTGIAQYLVMNGALTFVKSPAQDTLLHLAVKHSGHSVYGMSQMVEYLLKCGLGMYVNATNSTGCTALNYLLVSIINNVAKEQKALNLLSRVNDSETQNDAMRHEIVSTCRLLLNAGVNPNIADKQGSTSLEAANVMLARSGVTAALDTYLEVVRQLLSRGADPRLPNHAGQCPHDGFLRIAVSELCIPVHAVQKQPQLEQTMNQVVEGLKMYKDAGADFATSSCLLHWMLERPFTNFCSFLEELSHQTDALPLSEELLLKTKCILQAYKQLFHTLVVDCKCPVHCHSKHSHFHTLYYKLVGGQIVFIKLWKPVLQLFIYLGFDLNEKVTVDQLSNFEISPNNVNYGASPLQHMFYLLISEQYPSNIVAEIKQLIMLVTECMNFELVKACLKAVICYINTKKGTQKRRTDEVEDLVLELRCQPVSLQTMCRKTIYSSMHRKLYLVDSLPLPVALKTYLKYV